MPPDCLMLWVTRLCRLEAPLRKCDADDGDVEGSAFHHRIESGEDHLVGEIAGGAINHKSV